METLLSARTASFWLFTCFILFSSRSSDGGRIRIRVEQVKEKEEAMHHNKGSLTNSSHVLEPDAKPAGNKNGKQVPHINTNWKPWRETAFNNNKPKNETLHMVPINAHPSSSSSMVMAGYHPPLPMGFPMMGPPPPQGYPLFPPFAHPNHPGLPVYEPMAHPVAGQPSHQAQPGPDYMNGMQMAFGPGYCHPPPQPDMAPSTSRLPSTRPPSGGPPESGIEFIVGGHDAAESQFPYQALLAISNGTSESFATFCGGSLIAKSWVLSAAHCVCMHTGSAENMLKQIVVVLGDYNRSHIREPNEQWFRVKRIIIHKDWVRPCTKNRALDGDIMLMELLGEANLTSAAVQPIELPESSTVIPAGLATVTGWGTIVEPQWGEPAEFPDILQSVSVPIVDIDRCAEIYAQEGRNLSRRSQICAGYLGTGAKDSCQGDSGGPLVCHERLVTNEDDCDGNVTTKARKTVKPYLCGVVSFGEGGCGSPNFPGVYSNVAYYLPWIKKAMKTSGPGFPHSPDCDPIAAEAMTSSTAANTEANDDGSDDEDSDDESEDHETISKHAGGKKSAKESTTPKPKSPKKKTPIVKVMGKDKQNQLRKKKKGARKVYTVYKASDRTRKDLDVGSEDEEPDHAEYSSED